MAKKKKIISGNGNDWTFETLMEFDKQISRIAKDYLKLDTYPNQIEIVTSEQMIDAYSLIGLPVSYPHWKFGKDWVFNFNNYRKGRQGLAYELVINSNPCISYNMENNTNCMMALVLAHAAYGHNSFFKNNYMFKEWTDADSIIDYMVFARDYVIDCENKYGPEEVELVLDAAHALMNYGVDKYHHPSPLSVEEEKKRLKDLVEHQRESYNELWTTIQGYKEGRDKELKGIKVEKFPKEPEENILYFIEKNAPKLPTWKRELIRIVRKVAQYFYPQSQTKVMNEGWATMSHYLIIQKLFEEGYVDDGFMIEFYKSHTNVVSQPSYKSEYFSGINPYTLGFNIFMDIKRICEDPTEEDKKWFPELIGKDWLEEAHYAMKNFRDDSFILQYLSPKVIRDMKLFMIIDEEMEDDFIIGAIHNDEGYEKVREILSQQHSRSSFVPEIQVEKVDVYKDRRLTLVHNMKDSRELELLDSIDVMDYVHYLWEFPVTLMERVDNDETELFSLPDHEDMKEFISKS